MRAIKSSTVTFGLVSVPVKLYKAVDSHDIAFKQHHGGCGGPIGMERVCKDCEARVEFRDVVKGTTAADGSLVILDPEEVKGIDQELPAGIEVLQFTDRDEIDPIGYETGYYLAPASKAALEGYTLLRTVLEEKQRVGLVRFALRGRLSLGVLRAAGDTLVIHTLAWPDEVREPAFPILDGEKAPKPAMLEMARQLVDAMTGSFNPADHVDTYTERLGQLIEARAAGESLAPAPSEEEVTIKDLLAALEASIAKRKGTAA